MTDHESTLKYFQTNLYESYSAYTLWKMLYLSTSKNIVGEEMAKKYVEVQNYHPQVFTLMTRTALVTFVVMLLHSFDKQKELFPYTALIERKLRNLFLKIKRS